MFGGLLIGDLAFGDLESGSGITTVWKKTPTLWDYNPDNETNRRTFNSSTYNAAVTYDGVVTTDIAESKKIPAVWNDVDT